MYKKIKERNRVAPGANSLPTADELAQRLSGDGQMDPSFNQAAGLNRAEDGLPAVLDTVNRAENRFGSNSTALNANQVSVDNTPVPEIIICVSSIEQVNIKIYSSFHTFLSRTKTLRILL